MKKFKVKTPVETFEGVQLGFQFVNGEAIIEDEKSARLFKEFGYEVEQIEGKKETPKQEKKEEVKVEPQKKSTRKTSK